MASFFDLSGRGKMSFAGPQALWFLDQLVTNKVVDLPEGAGAEALLLTPKGRIEAYMRVLHLRGEEVFTDLDAVEAGPVAEFFNGRVFATRVRVSDVTGDYGMIRVLGTDARELLQKVIRVGVPAETEYTTTAFPEGFVAAVLRPMPGFDVWTQRGFTGEFVRRLEAAGASALSRAGYENLRVAGGVPLYSVDYDESYLPQEAAMEFAVHFQKGCYLGQEAVAMAQRGRIKRRLRHVIFEGAPLLGAVYAVDEDAGRVTSIGTRDGRSYGIGTVKTSIERGTRVTVRGDSNDGIAEILELPGTVHGPRVPSARELRERLKGTA